MPENPSNPAVPTTFILALAGLGWLAACTAQAADFRPERVAPDDPYSLKAEVEAAGGTVNGKPVMTFIQGPNPDAENKDFVLHFPTPDSWVCLPVGFHYQWKAQCNVRIKEPPFGNAEGVVFGIYYQTRNQPLLAFTTKLFSPALAFQIKSGESELTQETQLESALAQNEWQPISVTLRFERWAAALGNTEIGGKLTGRNEQEMLGYLSRHDGGLYLQIGTFVGWATVPTYTRLRSD